MSKIPASHQIPRDEVAFLERAFAGLPTSKSSASGTGDADGLLKFAYHQNPYMRAFTKVLWSGYAMARGQVADAHQRFQQARRDATVAAIDANTAKALEDAHHALEQAMAPDGTTAAFLQVLRDRTLQRLWSRVCETTGLPPPRFHTLLGTKPAVTLADIDAEEEAALAALRKQPPAEEKAEDPASDDESDEDDEGEEEDDEGDDAPQASAPAKVTVSGQRRGTAEQAAELLLSAASDVLRDLRAKKPQGNITISITIDGEGGSPALRDGKGDRDGDRKRRRRRR